MMPTDKRSRATPCIRIVTRTDASAKLRFLTVRSDRAKRFVRRNVTTSEAGFAYLTELQSGASQSRQRLELLLERSSSPPASTAKAISEKLPEGAWTCTTGDLGIKRRRRFPRFRQAGEAVLPL